MPYTRNRGQKEYAKERKKERSMTTSKCDKEKLRKERVSEIHTHARDIMHRAQHFICNSHLHFSLFSNFVICFFNFTYLFVYSFPFHSILILRAFVCVMCAFAHLLPCMCLSDCLRVVSVFRMSFIVSFPNSCSTRRKSRDLNSFLFVQEHMCSRQFSSKFQYQKPTPRILAASHTLFLNTKIVGFEIMRFVVFGSVIKTALR